MRRASAILLSVLLAGPAHAAWSGPAQEASGTPTDDALGAARDAWERGDWSRVRQLLEPMALDDQQMEDQALREQALPILADATLHDETLSTEVRQRLAGSHLDRILDANPDWSMPQGLYTPDLAQLFRDRLKARSAADAEQCVADRNACEADREVDRAELQAARATIADQQVKLESQPVQLIEKTKRSRGWALIPFGVGHFYNGNVTRGGKATREERRNIALGATFMIAEAGFGFTGLGLLLWRTTVAGCSRQSGFASGSLTCNYTHPDARDRVIKRRVTEEVMGWFFLGTMALDVVLAQILFRPETVTQTGVKTRGELEEEPKAQKPPPEGRKRARVRPTPAIIRGGGGLGIDVRF